MFFHYKAEAEMIIGPCYCFVCHRVMIMHVLEVAGFLGPKHRCKWLGCSCFQKLEYECRECGIKVQTSIYSDMEAI